MKTSDYDKNYDKIISIFYGNYSKIMDKLYENSN